MLKAVVEVKTCTNEPHLGHEPTQIHMNPGELWENVQTDMLLKNHRDSSFHGDLHFRHKIQVNSMN